MSEVLLNGNILVGVSPDFGEQDASKMATEAYIGVRCREVFCEATQLYEKMGELQE